jgi:uncharacterized protein YjdB
LKKNLLFILITFAFWSCEDKAEPKQEIGSIVVSPLSNILRLGQTIQFSALVIDKSNASMDVPVIWSTTNDQVATITKEGLVTAVGQGESVIYATIDNVQGMAEILVSINRRRMLSELFTSST